jgi:NAD(P)-dependent dehydrogenase (short-subunit alcohol dehydrogenase family)
MDLGIEGRVALVAGASRGIGRATAVALAREGADVYVLGRDLARLEGVAAEVRALGRRSCPIAVDVADRAALRSALAAATPTLGPPTLLTLAIAAMFRAERFERVSDETVDDLLATDLRSAIDLCRFTLPAMFEAKHGRIVAVGSLAARTGTSGGVLYATTKAALEGLVRGIALEYSRRDVTANALMVGFADTERLRERIGADPAARATLERASATRRLIAPSEVADTIAFLCSARAASITGSVVELTGGSHLNTLW